MANVDSVDPRMDLPPLVRLPGAPATITSVPQRAIDSDGVLRLGNLGITEAAYGDLIVQNALDAIATKIANGKGGAVLHFPFGSTTHFQTGVSFHGDAPISIIGGTGFNRQGAKLIQMPGCTTLFDLTSTKNDAPNTSQMSVEIGGFCVDTHQQDATFVKLIDPELVNVHDIKAASGAGWWRKFFDCRNVRTSAFDRMYLRNDHGGMDINDWRGTAFDMKATNGSTSNNFYDIVTQGWDTTFDAYTNTYPAIEGTIFTACHLGGKFGIKWGYQKNPNDPAHDFYVPPQLQFVNGHMNCQRSWFDCRGVAQLLIQGNTMELHPEFGYDDTGIYMENVLGFDITNNKMFTGTKSATGRATIVVGPGCTNGQISHITGSWNGAKTGPGIHFLGGSSNCSMQHVEVATAAGPIYAAGPNAGHYFDNASIRRLT